MYMGVFSDNIRGMLLEHDIFFYQFPDLMLLNWLNDLHPNVYERYAHDEESAEDQEETGWKYIHGDVFRYPKNKSLFAAALGSGTQLFTL